MKQQGNSKSGQTLPYYSEKEAYGFRMVEKRVWKQQQIVLGTVALVMPSSKPRQLAYWSRNQTLRKKLAKQLYDKTGYRTTVNPLGLYFLE